MTKRGELSAISDQRSAFSNQRWVVSEQLSAIHQTAFGVPMGKLLGRHLTGRK